MITPDAFEPGEDEIKVIGGADEGLHGNIYVIPTDRRLREGVEKFMQLAYEWDQTTFYVTELEGVSPEIAAPLFSEALHFYNIRLPRKYLELLTAGD